MLKTSSAFLAAVLCAGVAHAALQDGSALPPVQTRGDVAWISGGIGKAQAKAFEHAASRYPLTLEFLLKPERKGAPAEFAAAIPLTVADEHGKEIFSATSNGPFMLLRLREGRYTVTAQYHGRTTERRVLVGHGHRRVVFEWTIDARMAT